MNRTTPGRLHVLTDEQIQDRFGHAELARLAASGGADVVQFREKRPWTTRQLLDTVTSMADALTDTQCGLIVDDRADVAAAIDALGVHLGRNDLPAAIARRILGIDGLIGGTANSLDEALAVARTPVDYLGVGPVFGTRTKADPAPELGLETLAAIAAAVPLPVIAIGSITAARIPEVMATGVHGVAVVSEVVCAADPAAATRRCRDAIDAALAEADRAG